MRLAGGAELAKPDDRYFILWRIVMTKTLMAVAIAGAFALPAMADEMAQPSVSGDNIVIAQGGGGDTGASSRQPGVNPPGTISPGTPSSAATGADRDTGAVGHANPSAGATSRAAFDRLDKNHDGFISRDEYNGLHAGARGSTSSASMSGSMGSAPAGKGPGAQESATRSSESGAGK